jgi:serine/threonine-protein kinase HipA
MTQRREIEVWADWETVGGAFLMGTLHATAARGQEVFSFEYNDQWLRGPHCQVLDPALGLFGGPQYAPVGKKNFGLFLDSCPDRWGRVLMQRREAQRAREQGRAERNLGESDYLLGVHDGHRPGGLRFRTDGPFLDDSVEMATPPWTSLAELEHACRALEEDGIEQDPRYGQWIRMLIAPGASLGGARPKAGVLDEEGQLWIAKFPSTRDEFDVGAWEKVLHTLATRAGIVTPEARIRRFASHHHTFLTRRFDRTERGGRLHYASAITLLERRDGDGADEGASYLEIADLLIRSGARTSADLEQLFRRIVFSLCVSNTDDHLRNHGFLLQKDGWALSPAFDMNPDPHGSGLRLNISESDNAMDLDLAREMAPFYRISSKEAREIVGEVIAVVCQWREVARAHSIQSSEQDRMRGAFTLAAV